MKGVSIPRKAASKLRKPQKEKPTRKSVRYLFYFVTIILIALTALSVELYYNNQISMPMLEAFSSATISLLFPSVVFSYLLIKGQSLKTIIAQLGLTRDRLTIKNLLYGILLFLAVLALGAVLGLFSSVTNIPLPTNVQTVLAGTPLWFLIFTFLIAPINEEIFFRGFLVPRLGIVISAVIFAILHLSYLSISEFAAAFFFGLLAGYVFKKRRSLYASILAHALVNFLAILSLIYVGMYIHV